MICRIFPEGRLLLRFFFVSAVMTMAVVGCRGDFDTGDPGLVLSIAISPTPPMVGDARLIISLSDTSGAPVGGARIEVEGNMSHAGMVPVVDTALAEAPGRYGITDYTFTMAGDWYLDVRATLPDGRWVSARKPVNVVVRMGAEG